MTQVYEQYTIIEQEVWKTLFNNQVPFMGAYVSKEYINALYEIQFTGNKIPDYDEVEQILKTKTGWGIKVVSGLSPQKAFFQDLSQKKFPTTCWLRKIENSDYTPEPDMFHDALGHLPLLLNEEYSNFFVGISNIALKHINNPLAIELLGRLYWFTIEFGLIQESENLKIYGAGIISSQKEILNSMDPKIKKMSFNIDDIFNSDFDTENLQNKYFVINSFMQLYQSLPEIESNLIQRLNSDYKNNNSLVNLAEAVLFTNNWTEINESLVIEILFLNKKSRTDFENELMQLSDTINHHPELVRIENKLIIILTTHYSKCITCRDIELARKINKLLNNKAEVVTKKLECQIM